MNDVTLGSLLGSGDGVGALGSAVNGQELLNVGAGSPNADALANVNASGSNAANVLGNSTDMGLVAALTGQDGHNAIDAPVVDVPHDISVNEMPVADVHLQPEHA